MKEKDDKLEKFVKEHIDDFNQHTPSDSVWKNIHSNIPQKKNTKTIKMVPLQMVLKVAAVFIVLLGIGNVLFYLSTQNKVQEINPIAHKAENQENNYSYRQASPELAEIEDYYYSQVSFKLSEIQQRNSDPEILEEIAILDEEYSLLQKEFMTSPDDEIIIEEMIENFRLRLNYLENILDQLNRTEKESDYEKDTEDIIVFV